MEPFLLAFMIFCNSRNPVMPIEAQLDLGKSIWYGSNEKLHIALTLSSMCALESSMKVRKYNPEVKNNMDYLGTHNDLLFEQLKHEDYIVDAKSWRKSNHWKNWRKTFQSNPELGTHYACKAFVRKSVKWGGIDEACEYWKCGKVGSVRGIEYLMQVKAVRMELLTLYRQKADSTKGARR